MMWSKREHNIWKHKNRIQKRLINKTADMVGMKNTPENRGTLKEILTNSLKRELK